MTSNERKFTEEPVLEPQLAICDAHHHLWSRPNNSYLAGDYIKDAGTGHRIVSTVYVDCQSRYRDDGPLELRPLGETEWVDALAREFAVDGDQPKIGSGIVGFADLTLGRAVGDVLDGHLEISSRFKGIRHCAAWDASDAIVNAPTDPPEHLLLDRHFQEGFAELGVRQLSFDAWVYHPQIPDVEALARRFPDTRIILDHLGGPLGIGPYAGKHAEVFIHWKRSLLALAQCPNVVIKLGGIYMPLNGWGFHKRDTEPDSALVEHLTCQYYLTALEAFGTARCLFESNYPADKRSLTFRTLWNVFKRVASGMSGTEKAALFHDNAVRIYRLGTAEKSRACFGAT